MFGALHRNWKTAIDHWACDSAAATAVVKKKPKISDRYGNNIFVGNMVGDVDVRRMRMLKEQDSFCTDFEPDTSLDKCQSVLVLSRQPAKISNR